MKFELKYGDATEKLTYSELNNKLFDKVSSNFLNMIKRLEKNEQIYHNDTGYKIRKIEK